MRLWDCFLLDGRKALHRVSLAMLLMAEPYLLLQEDALHFWKTLKLVVASTIDVEHVIRVRH